MSGAVGILDVRTVSSHFPGIGRYAAGLARALASLGGPPAIRLLHAAPADPRLPIGSLGGIACDVSPFAWRQQWQVPRVLRRAGAALYHSPYYLMPFAPGVPAIVNCFDLIPLTVPGLFSPVRRFVYRAAHVLAFRAATVVLVPSDATRREVVRVFPSQAPKIDVLPVGWQFEPRLEVAEAARLRGALGVPDRYVLHVGSDKPHKNLRGLADAWRTLVERDSPAARGTWLVLAGPRERRYDAARQPLERLGAAGRILSLGMVTDAALDALYGGATLFVFPSLAEGFGLPVVEAMAHGTPVVCSSVAALLELSGGAAVAVDPMDTHALAAAIERLLGAPVERETLRAAGLARVAAFDWETVVRRTRQLYVDVLGGRR
jgi:alpha-1,3-rhamnosyl/mannosyltransferase